MSKSDDAKVSLRAAAEFLSKVPYASKRLTFVSDGINAYLSGNFPSLDHAFGLKLGKGKYERPDDPKHIELVCDALKQLFEGKPWITICELQGYDRKEFNRLWERYKSEAIERMVEKMEPDWDDGG